MCQACFANIAKLKAWRLRKPIPPCVFDMHIFLQLTQDILVSWSFWPHQKFLSIPSKSSHKPFGSKKQLMVYVGIAWVTAFMRISFPPMDSIFSFQPDNFFPALSFISAKTWFFDLPITDGRPSYFPCLVSCMGPRISKTSLLASGVVLWLKFTADLSALTFCPEAAS